MDVAGRIRQTYEKRPYPRVKGGPARARDWKLAPMDWITAIWQPTKPAPARILVAGCGNGAEAFLLRRIFPAAKITAVDFSPRSIRMARDSQRTARITPPIRFAVGDLTSRDFATSAGGNFDFITCHGVLSYIPKPERALKNLARCLNSDGALYLGVNGADHFSIGWRRVMAAFGHDLNHFVDGPALRRLLKLADSVAAHPPGLVAARDASYLAGDLFGALNHALPLADWLKLARRAGLHFMGSFAALGSLRAALAHGDLLRPRSRAEVAELLDWLSPASFHQLMFKRTPPAAPAWREVEDILDWKPQRTALYRQRFPKRRVAQRRLVSLILRSPSTNALVELRMPGWELEILRRSDGTHSLRQIIEDVGVAIPRKRLLRQLYLLHQLAILNFLPAGPKPARETRSADAPQTKRRSR